MIFTRSALFAATLIAAPPALAQQELVTLPEGCDAYLTAQLRNCTVQHHFTCAGDPAGHQRRVDFTEAGMVYAGVIDSETQWIESFHATTQHYETLEQSPEDPASFTELLETGEDTYDFTTLSAEIGPTRYVGRDALTGVTETIDGVTLEQTEYSIVAYGPDGAEEWRSSGNEFISREWRMFISGVSDVTTPDESWTTDDTPMEFLFPGDAGFLSQNPKYGCGALMSKLEVGQ